MVLTFLTHKLGKKMFVQKSFWSKFRRTLRQKPVTPGMLTFATTWATGSLLQQMWLSDQEQIDWQKCGRYLLYGGFFIAPTFYAWIRLSSVMYPKPGIKSAVAKTILEQITYTPLVISSFFFGMSLMEGKDVRKSMKEVSAKFLPTYHVSGIPCFIPSIFVIFINF